MKFTQTVLRAGATLTLGLLLKGTALAQGSLSLYGITFFGNELIKIDPATGTGSLVATLNESVSPYGIAFRGQDLFTFDANTDQIRGIDRHTGLLTSSINIGVGDLLGEGDLAFRSDGIGFLASALTPDFDIANDLFRFDVTTGTSTRIGSTAVTLDGLAFSGGSLFGIGQEDDATLYLVDQNTAALTAIGSLGLMNGSPFAGLSVASNGTLYGAVNDRLYTIDQVTGHATELDPSVLDIGFASVSGLAAATPDGGTHLFAGSAGALMLIGAIHRRRNRKAVLETIQ